jgi:predicted enzyme related to lactoylglutathione lyase
MVDDIEHALARVVEKRGSIVLPATHVDGYTFAMFKDPEGNTVGVVSPFPSGASG